MHKSETDDDFELAEFEYSEGYAAMSCVPHDMAVAAACGCLDERIPVGMSDNLNHGLKDYLKLLGLP
jgi:hypothetical protein